MQAADIQPVAPSGQQQSTIDPFLICVAANVVAPTFQVGASLALAANQWTAVGGTVPALATSIVVYTVAARLKPDTTFA